MSVNIPNLPTGYKPDGPRIAVRLKRKALAPVRQGDPWVFEDSIENQSRDGAPGDIAIVFDPKGAFAGAGLYDPGSPVRVKLLTTEPKMPPMGPELFRELARRAAELRKGKIPGNTDAWRLVNGDSDNFPGVVADKYANAMVCKFYSAAWLPWAGDVAAAIAETVPDVDSLVIRLSRELARLGTKERHGIADGMIFSPDPRWNAVQHFRENGITFEADLVRGQKTGFFLDQRDNRLRVGKLAANRDVLNVFSYSGGFSLYAAAGKAGSVASVDIDPHAIELCNRIFELNPACRNVPHEGLVGDAFGILADLYKKKRFFDIVVVDPPSFAKSAAEVPGALNSYGRLARLAAKLVRKDGILVFASCSSRVDADTLFSTVENAAGRPLEVFDRTFHAADHPSRLARTNYLKCLFSRVKA